MYIIYISDEIKIFTFPQNHHGIKREKLEKKRHFVNSSKNFTFMRWEDFWAASRNK